jgi:hypothetical protein
MLRKPRNRYAPWSIAGGADPDFADVVREAHRWALTGRDLLGSHRDRFGEAEPGDYDVIVRRLGYVWDCPQDGAASVVGYRCAGCGRTRVDAMAESRSGSGRAENVACVQRLCVTYAARGLDAMLELAPRDVEWIPHLAQGRVLRGTDELRAFLTEQSAQDHAPWPTQISSLGEHVLVRFESPDRDPRVLWSVYLFEHDRLVRAISFDCEAAAFDAAA